jgi:hypothetical protein
MKNILCAVLLFLCADTALPQFQARAGMGINFSTMPSLKDYLNQNYAPFSNQLGSFHSAIIFSGEVDYSLTHKYQIGIETAYQLSSFTYNYDIGQYELIYNIIMPTIVGYYVIAGPGFEFKFGTGFGLRFLTVDETLPPLRSSAVYKSTGFGIVLRGDGNTLLGGNIYANIGADIRYDFNGEPDSGGIKINNKAIGETVNFNSLSFGIRLGVTYFF